MGKQFLSIALIIIDYILLVYILHELCDQKKESTTSKIVLISVLVIENIILWDLMRTTVIASFIPTITLLIYSMMFLNGSLLKRFVAFGLTFLNLLVVNSLFVMIGSLFTPSMYDYLFNTNSDIGYYISVANKIFIFLEYKYLKHVSNHDLELDKKTQKFIITIILISILSIAFALNEFVLSNASTTYIGSVIITFTLMNVLIFRLCLAMSREAREKLNQDMLLKSLKYEEKLLDVIQEKTLELRHANHDFRHHLDIVKNMVKKNQKNEINDYINKLSVLEEADTDYINTTNIVLNYIINEKIKVAKKQNIKIRKSIIGIDANGTFIDNIDISIILGNLLDNAIEACKNVDSDNRFINITIKVDSGEIKYVIENSTIIKSMPVNSKIPTNKRDKIHHGYGLDNVKTTILKYDGEFIYSIEDYIFKFYCIIENNK